METEECITATAVPPPPPPLLAQQQQQQYSGRTRKRGGMLGSMSSSSVEKQVGSYSSQNTHHHHDKVLRSHTRRGRGAGPAPVSLSTPPLSGGLSSRRRQRSSACSSHTDEDDTGGGGGGSGRGREGVGDAAEFEEVSISLINCGDDAQDPGKIEEDPDDAVASGSDNNSSGSIIITSNNNNNKGVRRKAGGGGGGGVGEHDAVIIPSSSSCFSPTNETKELCEQAGLLGGTIKTTTIHSGGTRLSSSYIPAHNDGATQQCCSSSNAGEHSCSSSKGNDNNATINCSQKIAAAAQQRIMDNNVASRFRRRSHRQHGHQPDLHRGERSTPPAAAVVVTAADKDGHDDEDDEDEDDDESPLHSHHNNNAGRARRESSYDNDDEEMCQEDAASCELPGEPNTGQSESSPASSSSPSLSLLESSSSLLVVGALSSSVTITATNPGAGAAVTASLVKSERGGSVSACGGENGGKEKEEKNANKKRATGSKEPAKQEESVSFPSGLISVVKQEPGLVSGDAGREHGFPTTGETGGALKVTKIGGHDDGRWSAGEDARQSKGKDGAKGEWTGLSLSVSSLPSSSSVVCSGAATSMPQKAGVKGSSSIQLEDGGSVFAGSRNEQSRTNKVSGGTPPSAAGTGGSVRVKKCSSKKQPVANSPASGFTSNHTFSAQCGGKSASGGGEQKKASVPAPMLLMNNLPYMGELTFDTRPRRGRKPKKADICHLISKNYGIHFPAGVTQATLTAAVTQNNSKPAPAPQGLSAGGGGTSSRKKASAETSSASAKNNAAAASRAGAVPPTFCNRDVSIVPIIPTTWGGSGGGGGGGGGGAGRNVNTPLLFPITSDSSKCSPSTAANLLKPLSSLAQQLMLHHHQNHQNSSSHCSVTSSSTTTTRGMTTMTSSPQQTISMFPLPTPSSFSQSHHPTAADVSRANTTKRSKTGGHRETEYTGGEDVDENMMEVDIESLGGDEEEDDEDNQDSPLNLCMRDKSMMVLGHPRYHEPLSLVKEEALDVRWGRGGAGRGGGGAIKGLVRSSRSATSANNIGSSSYCSDGAMEMGGGGGGGGGSSGNKRGMMQTSIASAAVKSGKSAKLMGSSSGSSTGASLTFSLVNSSNSNNICDSDSVSNLVSCRPSPSPSSSPLFGNVQPPSKLSPNIFAISAHHLQNQGLENTGKAGGKSKQGGQSRKKRELNLRGDISISTTGSPGSQSGTGGNPSGSGTLSSFGGTLFGQSTAGINDGAEVSICKFKFTGGAKPCLQEKKMLSVDSGGNFRFYSDKTSGTGGAGATTSTGKLAGKGQSQQLPMTSSSGSSTAFYSSTSGRVDLSQSPPSTGDGMECHYALSSLPKSAKSMSMCMPVGSVNNTGIQVKLGSAAQSMGSSKCNSVSAKLSLPLMPQSSSAGGAGGNPYAALSISPTTEELQQLHLNMQDQVQQQSRSSSRVSPYPSGDYSYSSSNSCSSSDNCFGGDPPSSAKSNRQACSGGGGGNSHHARGGGGSGSSSKMKLKRKRRTRKSLMREKLEKTFKEKGFLIQTQQLESAEGATYCKFRQLRKFTRYLFRSWKDYLPDHVKDISDNSANNNNNNNNGTVASAEQALPSSDQPSNLTGQKEADSNVQSMADDDGDMEDDEDEGDEEEEEDAESEEQPRQSLISQDDTLAHHNEEESEDDEEEEEDKGDHPRRGKKFKSSRRRRQRKCAAATNSGRAAAAATPPSKSNSGLRDDSEKDKDEDNEDVELQVDA